VEQTISLLSAYKSRRNKIFKVIFEIHRHIFEAVCGHVLLLAVLYAEHEEVRAQVKRTSSPCLFESLALLALNAY
jgi:hypothetical protein